MEKKRESDFSVEPTNPPTFIVETTRLDTTSVLPCADDATHTPPTSVDTVTDDTVALDPWIVEKTDRFHETVDPATVDTPIVLIVIELPEKVE